MNISIIFSIQIYFCRKHCCRVLQNDCNNRTILVPHILREIRVKTETKTKAEKILEI